MQSTRRSTLVSVLLTLVVVLAGTPAPAAAAPGDGGLLGGDEGSGADGVTGVVGETVNDTTGAADGATETVTNATGGAAGSTADAAVETATNATGSPADGAVGAPAETVGATADAASETVGTGPAAAAGEAVDSATDAASDSADGATAGAVPAGETGDTVAAAPSDVAGAASTVTGGTASPESGGTAAPAAGDALERGVGTGLLPIGPLPVDQLPVTGDGAPVEPEDSPYGSDAEGRLDACQLPVRSDDLPLAQVPGPSELPVEINIPGVPTSLLTPETVAQLAFAVPPRPCQVYDPHNPSLDPTEPPSDPEAVAELSEVDVGADGVQIAGGSLAMLEEDGFRGTGLAGVIANTQQVSGGERLNVTDGQTRKYLYLESVGHVLVERRVVNGDMQIAVFGKSFAVTGQCELRNASAPSADDPLGPCEYDYTGLPEAITPADIVDLVENPPSQPPVRPAGAAP